MCPILEELLLWTYSVLWSLKNYLRYQMQALVKRHPFKRNFKCHRSCISQSFIKTLPETTSPLLLMEKWKKRWNRVSLPSAIMWESANHLPSLPLPCLHLNVYISVPVHHTEKSGNALRNKLGKVQADGKAKGQKTELDCQSTLCSQLSVHTTRPKGLSVEGATRGLWRLCHRITCYVESDEHTVDTGISNANTVFKNGALL